jgi:hypothetical protein
MAESFTQSKRVSMGVNRKKAEMGDILGYKDALQYRDDLVQSKISQGKHADVVQKTLSNIIT